MPLRLVIQTTGNAMITTTQSQCLKTTEINFLLVHMFIVGHYEYGKGLLMVIQGSKADGSIAILTLLVVTPQGKEGSGGPCVGN